MRPRSEVAPQHLRIALRKGDSQAAAGRKRRQKTGLAEKYFSASRTEAGSHESINKKWMVTVRPAKRLKQRMAVTGQTNEEKKAAAVVSDVTSIDRPAWAKVSVTNLASVVPSLSNLVQRQT